MIDTIVAERELFPMSSQTAKDCVERAAFWLYEAERLAHPDLLPWDEAPSAIRNDFRYRAVAAQHEGDQDIRRVRIQRIAQTLATADGFVWPACSNKINHDLPLNPEQIAAIVAERRQHYLHVARLIDSAEHQYMEVMATDETPELRQSVISAAHQQQIDDEQAVKTWRLMREGRL